jgi:alkylation response protein AidB-like acyl-CoA dehydrogenase
MDVEQLDTPEMAEFRREVRAWAIRNRPDNWQQRVRDNEDLRRPLFAECAARLREAGYLAPHWPREFGGGEYPIALQMVVRQELQAANFPPVTNGIGLHHAAATLMVHGTSTQQKHLQSILEGEIWCQGFSEPDAGSDLASLKTTALREGDTYVVNGQKIWSSGAQHADWCLLLARTNPGAPKHAGISVFMLDVKSEGVEVRPIRQASGSSEFCEIFLSDVRVPVDNRVGPENEGWRIAQTTLSTERASMIIGFQTEMASELNGLLAEAARGDTDGMAALDRPGVGFELAQRAAEVEVLGMLVERVVGQLVRHGEMGPEGSALKLFYSETFQRLSDLALRVRGMRSLETGAHEVNVAAMQVGSVNDHVRSWVHTISAGSNEIQRNIIAERVLGLPREPVPA